MIDKDTGTLKRAVDGDACNFTVIMDKITVKSKTTSEQPPFYIAFVNNLKKKNEKRQFMVMVFTIHYWHQKILLCWEARKRSLTYQCLEERRFSLFGFRHFFATTVTSRRT